MLSANQIKVAHLAKRHLALTDDDYRAILLRAAGVASSKELELLGFIAVMAEFERLGFRSTWRRATGGYRPGMATPSQIKLIAALWRDYRREDDEAGFRHWLERFHHVSDVRFITAHKANGVITALKRMAGSVRAT